MDPLRDTYVLFDPGDGPGCALNSAPEHDQRILFYLRTDDIDAVLAKVSAAGGSVLIPKREIGPDVGHIALFTDPAGNKIGLFTSVGDH